MKIYSVIMENFTKEGESCGRSRITEGFQSLESAKEYAEGSRLSPLSVYEVWEYDEKNVIVMSDGKQDTGKLVFRDISGVFDALRKEFTNSQGYEDFEGTMSCLIDLVKDAEFEELAYLKAPVNALKDEEVNELLQEYGDDEYVVCRNGVLTGIYEKKH